MGPFIARCAAFAALGLVVWTLCTALFLNGYTDDFYLRVASPRQPSLILGTSRAAQGIVPAEINARSLGCAGPLYNFAFSSANSRYGRAYFEAIQRKVIRDASGAPGLFILEVSPLSISTDKGSSESFPEDENFLGQLHSFSLAPNPEYAFYRADRGLQIIERTVRRWRGQDRLFLHADGWLEVKPKNDPLGIEVRIRQKLEDYRRVFETSEFSATRSAYLRSTVSLLMGFGRAVLVRLPIDARMEALERAYMPGFDARMNTLARELGATYLDMSDLSSAVATEDANHLRRDSARKVSRELQNRFASAERSRARHEVEASVIE